MINLNNLSVSYGSETAIDKINLEISRDTTVAIIGPSGCGKTTLLYAVAGLIEPSTGSVLIDGEEILTVRKNTGVILQNSGLLPWKTGWENVALGLKARRLSKGVIQEKVNEIISELGLTDHQFKYPSQLSGGQKQRFAIARTLVLEPDVLLLDEASSSLDAINRENIQNLILKLYKKQLSTLIMVTHSIEEAVFLGQTIVVMKRAGIRKVIQNPYFGDDDIRSKPEYYHICHEVRTWLESMEAGEAL